MFFIIGNPRSGTSLLRLLLTTNPALHVPPECGFMAWWAEKYADAPLPDDPNAIKAFAADIASSKKFEFWEMSKDEVAGIAGRFAGKHYAEFCKALYVSHAAKHEKPDALIGDKNNFHITRIPLINDLQPNSRYVHIVRDGRDVAASYMALNEHADAATSKYYPKLATTIDQAAGEWARNVMDAHAALEALGDDQWIEVRYEDLVCDTVTTLQRICRFLKVPYNPVMLRYHEYNRRQSLEPVEFSAWKQRTFQSIDDSAIGRHSELGEDAIATFNKIAGEPLSLYGYL